MPRSTIPQDRPFAKLTALAQVSRLRRAAIEALADYPVDVRSVRLLLHGFNTSFRVDTHDDRRFVLRLNVANPKSSAALDAEVAWLSALSQQTDLVVPSPLATRSGRLRTSVWSEAVGRDLPAILMSWLPGRDLDDPTPEACRALGRVTAQLHQHASGWKLPDGAELPLLATIFMDVPNRLQGDHPLLTADRRAVIDAAITQVQPFYDELIGGGAVHPIHADLHGGNLKWLRKRLAVFDFDDAMMGTPVHDLAISAYYLRDESELARALLDGYADVRSLPEFTPAQFEALVAGRNLVVLNDVIHLDNAEIRAIAPTYVANTTLKLAQYLETGAYRHDVDGIVPLGG